MNRKLTLLLFLCLMGACTSPRKLFEQKNYYQAYNRALKELRKDTSSQTHYILTASLDSILATNRHNIDNLLKSDELHSIERALRISQNSLNKINAVAPYIDSHFDSGHAQFSSIKVQLRQELSQAYFNIGKSKLEEAIITEYKGLAKESSR